MARRCFKCMGIGWVCENHPNLPWSDEIGCQCGAGMVCSCNRAGEPGIDEPDVSQVIEAPSGFKH
jgi:hypothetical protein